MNFENFFFNSNEYILDPNQEKHKGAYAKVYKATKNGNKNVTYAAKVINSEALTEYNQKSIMREASILQRLNHKAIIKFYGFSFNYKSKLLDMSSGKPTIIMDYAENGSLRSNIEKLTSTQQMICLIGIADAMRYAHEKNIVHRDLKPENIVLDKDFHPKICDFGLARELSKSSKTKLTTNIGTERYMAPELKKEITLSKSDDIFYAKMIDVYSFGVMAYEILTKNANFKQEDTDKINSNMKNLIENCLKTQPLERHTFNYISNYLKNYIENTLVNEEISNNEENQETINSYIKQLEEQEKEEPSTISMNYLEEETINQKLEEIEKQKNGLIEMLKALFSHIKKKELSNVEVSGEPLLHYACKIGDLNFVKYLIEFKELEKSIINKEGSTILHSACESGNLELIEYLTQSFDINKKNNNGKTPFHIACESGNTKVVNLLIQKSQYNDKIGDFDIETKSGLRLLHFACMSGNEEMYTTLSNYEFKKDKSKLSARNTNDGSNLLHYAALSGNIELVKNLKEKYNIKSTNNTGVSVLHCACSSGKLKLVKYIVDELKKEGEQFNINNFQTSDNTSLIHFACSSGNVELVKYLYEEQNPSIELNNLINDNNCSVLHCACRSGNLNLVEYLWFLPVNVKTLKTLNGFTIWHLAIQSGNAALVTFLLNRKELNQIDKKAVLKYAKELKKDEIAYLILNPPYQQI